MTNGERHSTDSPNPGKKGSAEPGGVIVVLVRTFLTGPLSIMLIVAAVAMGTMALLMTPREEEPQIVVPMIDVAVSFPGHSPAEVEQLVTTPLERLLWQVDGVEHVYSVSRRDEALVTVRFYVGEDWESSLVKVRDKMEEGQGEIPPGVTGWTVNSVDIDDVPIVTLTFFSPERTPFELRRIVEEVKERLNSLRDISLSKIYGGYSREILIEPDIEGMAARGVSIPRLVKALTQNNQFGSVGSVIRDNQTIRLLVGPGLDGVKAIEETVVCEIDDGLIKVEDVADVRDGPAEQTSYVDIGFGPAAEVNDDLRDHSVPAVTLTFSKKKGTNAVTVAENVIRAAEELKSKVIPGDVEFLVTRNYGKIANQKVNSLVSGMFFAIVTVVGLITLTMGWREGLVVGLAVPVSFALALFVNYVAGFTINRVTLFALILSLGLVVDDPITNVDNIQRHIRMGVLDPFRATLAAVHEVIPPVIMSTLAIIISFTPMFFITGMMGPYMGPMAINVPLTVSFSTLCALTFVPWLCYHLLKGKAPERAANDDGDEDATPRWIKSLYRTATAPFLERRWGFALLAAIVLLLLGSSALMLFKVPLKMLPFDNKDELQIVLDLPEGASLEKTRAVVGEIQNFLRTVNEVKDFESHSGVNAPIDFNGLVRHYGMRVAPNQADVRVNLVDKDRRVQQSHTIALRIRNRLETIAARHDVELKLVEVPPGPPVLATLTVEVYGDHDHDYQRLIQGADQLKRILADADPKHIVEIDDMSETPHPRLAFKINREKAAAHGLTVADATRTLRTAVNGQYMDKVHIPEERVPLLLRTRLPLAARSDPKRLGQLWLPSRDQPAMTQLAELGRFEREIEEQPIYHKNLERVVFVTAECVGRPPGEMIMEILFSSWERPFKRLWESAVGGRWRQELPNGTVAEWGGEGEWQITVRVFRDLGIAFGVAMLGIFLLLVVQTSSVTLPLIIMCAIPLTIIGIAPGFFLLNGVMGNTVAGYSDSVFFTATGMIGMIALGGIVIRNSIVLIEFIQYGVANGMPLREAILRGGAVRFRPITLTALTTMLGAWPITLDPVFSGLAWALIFGMIASTVFTLVVIPTVYMLIFNHEDES